LYLNSSFPGPAEKSFLSVFPIKSVTHINCLNATVKFSVSLKIEKHLQFKWIFHVIKSCFISRLVAFNDLNNTLLKLVTIL